MRNPVIVATIVKLGRVAEDNIVRQRWRSDGERLGGLLAQQFSRVLTADVLPMN